ncbi:MAG TPA: ATP-binding cassette domain-containing protein [Streptosporangiaceae bacterium]|nr:ATP-binding cassette domain-containing protein [Streptosporangiaceae bacterium]
MTALAARDIRKSFGRRQVLTGVDLEVAAGELVAVVGENGTGKTTLLRILAGDLRPDAGSVAIDGRPRYCPQAAAPSTAAPSTAAPSTDTPSTSPHHWTLTAAVAQASGGPGRNPGESGLPADQRVVPPPAARAGQEAAE